MSSLSSHLAYFLNILTLCSLMQGVVGDVDFVFVGDLSQYTTNGVPTPTLTGSAIQFTAVGDPSDNGIMMFLSPDKLASLQGALGSSCEVEFDSACYDSVMHVLENDRVILQARDVNVSDELAPRQWGFIGAGVVALTGVLFPVFYKDEERYVPQPLVIPPTKIEDAFGLETATSIVVATSSSVAMPTITQSPEQTAPTGAAAAITTFASAVGGAKPGDVAIELDPAVAAHVQALLSGTDKGDCDVGADFFDNPTSKRALDLADVVCGAQNLLADGIGREGIPDYLIVDPGRLPWTGADVVAAVHTVVAWALTRGARLNPGVPPQELRWMAVGAFGLSWAFIFNRVITTNNIIPAASLQGGPAATACPLETATQCGARCGVYAWAPQYECTTTCSTVTSCDATSALTTTLTTTFPVFPHVPTGSQVPPTAPLQYRSRPTGQPVKPGTELRILPVGDSITYGLGSNGVENGVAGDGNGYRLKLHNDLANDNVVFAGTVESSVGTMADGWFAAWSGKTIQYIADHVGDSLQERPNIILLHAGTNDMNQDTNIAIEGNDPVAAVGRLSSLISKMLDVNPSAVIIVAMIINVCSNMAFQKGNTNTFNSLIPDMVYTDFASKGHHVLTADFSSFPSDTELQDCVHPTAITGYHLLGDYWYDFVSHIPPDWIEAPEGPDSTHTGGGNGGIATDIPPPNWGPNPVQRTSFDVIYNAWGHVWYDPALTVQRVCSGPPKWYPTGEIALGLGHMGAWKYAKNWVSVGEVASGIQRDAAHVRLHDMNGDGKADYVWLDAKTGMIVCWLNNLPDSWSPAGTNNSIIGSGAGPADSVFIADMNADGLEDYMVVDPDNGAVKIWWNWGSDDNWVNGWKFTEGGQIASGVRHANWDSLRFPDINGDGRADYVVVGEGGALLHYLNTGTAGGTDVLFLAQGGIATGAVSNITTLVFADMNGDGRDDYLIWDDEAGLTGFLNQPTHNEGVPLYITQGPAKAIADGVKQLPSSIRLADLDGDGKDDYVYIDGNGALWLWWNRGTTDSLTALDNIRFADIDGDGVSGTVKHEGCTTNAPSQLDDYIWLETATGAPTVYLNSLPPNSSDVLGWKWNPMNGGSPIASGAGPASQVQFGDINGDGKDDYLVLDPVTGELTAYLNGGPSTDGVHPWTWEPIGSIATGLGPGSDVRFADIDGDGYDDYIFLHPNGGTTIYRNVYSPDTPLTDWRALPSADASGISRPPSQIHFADINGDGRADYIWTRPEDGAAFVWLNDYPNLPTWLAQGQVFNGIAASGSLVRYPSIALTGRADVVAVDPTTGAISAWLNGCNAIQGPRPDKVPH